MLPAPRPHPDELVYSALVRCCRLFNLPQGTLARHVLGARLWRPSFLGTPDLKPVSELFRISAEDILWKHSVFPYVTATMPTDAFERALRNSMAADGDRKGLGSVVDIAASGVRRRRFCRLCAADELKAFGHSFWHRSHNLPGVWICLAHKVFLERSEIETTPCRSGDSRLPHDCVGEPLGRGTFSKSLLRMAEISTEWLSRPRGPGEPLTSTDYRRLATENAWAAPGKRLDTHLVADGIRTLFDAAFLDDAKMPLLNHRRSGWPFLMLRPGVDMPFLPAKHAAMQTFLESERPESSRSLEFHPAGAASSPAQLIDDFYARAAKHELRRVLKDKLVLTTDQFVSRVGCLSHYRRQRRNLPNLSAVVREFRGSSGTVKRLKPGKKLFRDD